MDDQEALRKRCGVSGPGFAPGVGHNLGPVRLGKIILAGNTRDAKDADLHHRGRQTAWALLCVAALLLSGVRLAKLDASLLRQRKLVEGEQRLEPALGTFNGIGADGYPETAAPGHGSGLLLFVIHSQGLAANVGYWNRVVRAVEQGEAQSRKGISFWYWGVCDGGTACNSLQSKANFQIIAFMEPYEMRIASTLDAEREAAVYGKNSMLVAKIPLLPSPAAEAKAVLEEVR